MKTLFLQLVFLLIIAISFDARGKLIEPKNIYTVCHEYKYHRCDVLTAMAFVESRFKSDDFNREEMAFGLFQMTCKGKKTAARIAGLKYGCDQLFNHKISIHFAIEFLKKLDPRNVLPDDELVAAWNADKIERCERFKEYRWGVCYPNELKNQVHVDKVMKHLKYIRKYFLLDWLI